MKTLKFFIGTIILTLGISVAAFSQVDLTSLDGSKVNIEAKNGKIVILAIGARWLPLSDNQAEFTNTLAKKYAGKNVVVYFVATDSTAADSKNFASNEDIRKFGVKNKLTVTILRDPDGAATVTRYKLEQVPSFVILDKQGKLAGEPFGGISTGFDITIPISKKVDSLM